MLETAARCPRKAKGAKTEPLTGDRRIFERRIYSKLV
jgi:hypothetical protein